MRYEKEKYFKIKQKNKILLTATITVSTVIVVLSYVFLPHKNPTQLANDSNKSVVAEVNFMTAKNTTKPKGNLDIKPRISDLLNTHLGGNISSVPNFSMGILSDNYQANKLTSLWLPTDIWSFILLNKVEQNILGFVINLKGSAAHQIILKYLVSNWADNTPSRISQKYQTLISYNDPAWVASDIKTITQSQVTDISQVKKKSAYHSISPSKPQKFDSNGVVVTVQLVSLEDPIEAQAIKAQLASKGFPARVESFKNGDKIVYRVRVGAYNNRKDALKVISKLKSVGYFAVITR